MVMVENKKKAILTESNAICDEKKKKRGTVTGLDPAHLLQDAKVETRLAAFQPPGVRRCYSTTQLPTATLLRFKI